MKNQCVGSAQECALLLLQQYDQSICQLNSCYKFPPDVRLVSCYEEFTSAIYSAFKGLDHEITTFDDTIKPIV